MIVIFLNLSKPWLLSMKKKKPQLTSFVFLLLFSFFCFAYSFKTIPLTELNHKTLQTGDVIDFSSKNNPLWISLNNKLISYEYEISANETNQLELKWTVPLDLPAGKYELSIKAPSNSFYQEASYQVKIESLIYIHLYGYVPPKSNVASSGRDQIQSLFDVFRTAGKVNEFNINTLFEKFTTIENINKNLVSMNDEAKKAFHLFYFYLWVEEGESNKKQKEVFLADKKLPLKEMIKLLYWTNLNKAVWINSANPAFPKFSKSLQPLKSHLHNVFFILEEPLDLIKILSNLFQTGGEILNRNTGKNFLTLRDTMRNVNHFPDLSMDTDLLNIPIISYEWIPEEAITNVITTPKFRYITNSLSNRYVTRNFLVFEVAGGEQIVKIKESDELEYKIKKKKGYWK